MITTLWNGIVSIVQAGLMLYGIGGALMTGNWLFGFVFVVLGAVASIGKI